jgi:hypothetical protein
MVKLMMVAVILGLSPLAALADVTQDELQKLAAAGVSEKVILEFIKIHGPVQKLSAQDVVALRKAGATDKVLAAALASARVPVATATATASTPPPPPAAPPQNTVVVQEPTYVYDSYPSTLYYASDVPYSFSFGYPIGCVRPTWHWCPPRTHVRFFPFHSRFSSPRFSGISRHR